MKRFSVSLIPALILCVPLHGMDKVTDRIQGTQAINEQQRVILQQIALDAVSDLKQIIAEKKPHLSEVERTVLLMQLVTDWFDSTKTTINPR